MRTVISHMIVGLVTLVTAAGCQFSWQQQSDAHKGSTNHRRTDKSFSLGEDYRLALPTRPAGALGGEEFLKQTEALSAEQREEAIYREIMRGNVPNFLRTLIPIRLTATDKAGSHLEAIMWVLPDYLAIGSDDDFVRIPMNLVTASSLAHNLGLALPTKKIVDAIYAQSDIHAKPQALPPNSRMTSNAYYLRHDELIDAALGSYELGQLVAGHKKDIVISNKLNLNPGRIVIYGWHRSNGKPIQPLSNVHGARYADYSHGVRLVSAQVLVNGQFMNFAAAVEQPSTASLFTYEGTIANYGELMGARIAHSN